MTLVQARINGKDEDILLVAERLQAKSAAIMAYKGEVGKKKESVKLASIPSPQHDITLLEACQEAMTIVGVANELVCVTTLKATEDVPLDARKNESYLFDAPEGICALDVRQNAPSKKKSRNLNIILGSIHGRIFIYEDVLNKLARQEMGSFQARRLHWHRRAVHALKWSRDGQFTLPIFFSLHRFPIMF
jgi:NET1-associated nuclear protein 1 (U3 small nucleolar RNA-associated protein 17)